MAIVKQCAACGKSFSLTPSVARTRTHCSVKCKAASMVVDSLPPRIGAWTVLRRDESDVKRMVCRCDCGTERSMHRTNLYQGTTTSCGCIKRKRSGAAANRKDLTGQRFERWLVLSMEWVNKKGWAFCRCDCGTERKVRAADLSNESSQSCGCIAAEKASARGIHWSTETPTYGTWLDMRRRCNDPNRDDYAWYGGMGIYVCERWDNDYREFVRDVGERPSKGLSIDRVDTNGSYTCGKCDQCKVRGVPMNARWATATQQVRNRRSTRMLTVNGETKPLGQWAEEHRMSYQTLHSRLYHRHWTPEEAVSIQPLCGNNQSTRT